MMKTSWFGLGCLIFLVAAPCFGADIGMITLVDGKPKVLRGTAWFNLSEGVRVRDGDTLDVPDKGQLQLELTDGGAVSVVGPRLPRATPSKRPWPSCFSPVAGSSSTPSRRARG